MKNIDVTVLGHALIDHLFEVPEEFLTNHNLFKSSMSLIDEKQAAYFEDKFQYAKVLGGGSAINTAIGISDLGGKSAAMGKVGKDQLGKLFVQDLIKHNIELEIATDYSQPTGRCYVAITPDHERTMCTYLGASKGIQREHLNKKIIESSKLCYIEAYLWDSSVDAIYEFARLAKQHNAKVALSIAGKYIAEKYRSQILDFIDHHCHIIFANKSEIESLLDITDFDKITKEVRKLVDIAVITLGKEGAVAITEDEVIKTPGIIVHNVIDHTGAGDLFASGFLYSYVSQGKPIKESLDNGNEIAAKIIQKIGVRL